MWRCDGCGRRFARKGQAHKCVRMSADDHLLGKSARTLELFDRFIELVRRCGTFEYSVTKLGIGLQGERRIFAGLTPGNDELFGYLDLPYAADDLRLKVVPYTKKLWVHHFHIKNKKDLDASFVRYIADAYKVGQGQHLASKANATG